LMDTNNGFTTGESCSYNSTNQVSQKRNSEVIDLTNDNDDDDSFDVVYIKSEITSNPIQIKKEGNAGQKRKFEFSLVR